MRTCGNCGAAIASPNKGRGKWQRWCSDTCRTEGQKRRRVERQRAYAECTVTGCTSSVRSGRALYCELHYGRIRRNGHIDRTVPEYRADRGICIVEGCREIDHGPHGYCAKHRTRQLRHGDPLICLPRGNPAGHEHHSFKGEDIRYGAAHERVRVERGPAKAHDCIDCGKRAAHWSYNHSDPNELRDLELNLPFSADPEHYSPRCVPCHKAFDLGRERISA